MKQLFLLLFACLSLQVCAQQTGRGSLSPWLRRAVNTGQHRKMAMGRPSQDGSVIAFVETRRGDVDAVMQEYGCRKHAQLGRISIATIPLSRLKALSQHPLVKRIEASPSGVTTMDTVPRLANILPVYTATSQHPAFTGRGVVVGLVDVGFDLTHPTFYDSQLSDYRIRRFWDQLSKDTIGSPLPVGRDFTTREDILALGCATDGLTQRHGTHTAGTAVGSGYDSPYRGVAYESDLCLVANAVSADTIYIDPKDYYKFTSATDALGFKYLFDYADEQGKPCVVSFSEGYAPYLDDEDRLYSEFLDQLIGPGRILVASAGNENGYLTYVDKPRDTETAGAFVSVSRKQALFRIKSDGPLDIVLYGYDTGSTLKQTLRFSSEGEWEDDMQDDSLFIGAAGCAVTVEHYRSETADFDTYYVYLSADKRLNQLGNIALAVEGQGCHAEIFGSSSNAFANLPVDERWNAAVKGHSIFAPGCFAAPICVGCVTHRISFTNVNGEYKNYERADASGKLSVFSSTGPAMNGLTKPDVSAPGNMVIASHSSYYLEKNPGDVSWDVAYFDYNGRTYVWGAESGTSMSAPVVAGTIALWLQAKPTLTRDDIIGVFSRTCRHPEASLTYPNNEYGYGEIDAYRGLLDILGITKIAAVSQHQPRGVQVFVQNGTLHLLFSQPSDSPVNVRVYSVSGAVQYEGTVLPHTAETTLSLPLLPAGVYAVQLTGKSRSVTGSQLIRL